MRNAIHVMHEKMLHMFVSHVSFDNITYDRTTTETVYSGSPYNSLTVALRAKVFEEAVRTMLSRENIVEDAITSNCVNGQKRGRPSSSYDFLMNGKTRVEVKTGQLRWCNKKWMVSWDRIKRVEYDELFLAMYTPNGLYVYKHDHVLGRRANNKRQRLHITASRSLHAIDEAIDAIHKKMEHMYVGFIDFESETFTSRKARKVHEQCVKTTQ